MTDTYDRSARPLKRKVTANKTPLDAATARRVKKIQETIDRARKRIDGWRKSSRRDSSHTIKFVEDLAFIEGRLADGERIAIRFVNGVRHPDTGFNHFVIASCASARTWSSSPYRGHKWFARRATNGDYEVRLEHAHAGGQSKPSNAARVLYELAHPGALRTPRHRVVIKERGDIRNGLDLRLSNLELEAPAEYRPRKSTPKPPCLDDLRAEIENLVADRDEERGATGVV